MYEAFWGFLQNFNFRKQINQQNKAKKRKKKQVGMDFFLEAFFLVLSSHIIFVAIW